MTLWLFVLAASVLASEVFLRLPFVAQISRVTKTARKSGQVLRKAGKTRYVSKNNNNILRIATLAKAMPDAVFLVPLRDPLTHAASLLAQHRRFLDAEPFTQQYMIWLGHHEFGATHRPFVFGKSPKGDPMTLDYWLDEWILAHAALEQAEAAAGNVVFVPYEALSRDPAVWQAVAARIGLTAGPAGELREVRETPPGAHSAGLADQARALHAKLTERAFAALSLPRG